MGKIICHIFSKIFSSVAGNQTYNRDKSGTQNNRRLKFLILRNNTIQYYILILSATDTYLHLHVNEESILGHYTYYTKMIQIWRKVYSFYNRKCFNKYLEINFWFYPSGMIRTLFAEKKFHFCNLLNGYNRPLRSLSFDQTIVKDWTELGFKK